MLPLDRFNKNLVATRIAVKFNNQLNPTYNSKLSAKLTARLGRTIGEMTQKIYSHLIPGNKFDPKITGKGAIINKKS